MVQTAQINRKNIIVIGDSMLDQYFCGRVARVSPEAPVPVLRKETVGYVAGGAANTAVNLAAGGQNVFLMSVFGQDEAGDTLLGLLRENQIDISLSQRCARCTTVKTRFLGDRQQLLRMDTEITDDMPQKITDSLLGKLWDVLDRMELVVISDYRKGLLTGDFTQGIIRMAGQKQKKVLVDVKDPDVRKYRGAWLLKPNLQELSALTQMNTDSDEAAAQASAKLLEMAGCSYVLTTCGARGMILAGKKLRYQVRPVAKEVFDVTGAGDTALAYLAVFLANGYGIQDAVTAANQAAGIQVARTGTAVVRLQEVLDEMGQKPRQKKEVQDEPERRTQRKMLSGREISECRSMHKNRKLVFTNGCFDILHTGHIRCLQAAAQLGDILVVGLNSDASVKRLKGSTRPLNCETDRAQMLCALECVDYVAVFDEDTPERLIAELMPDVLAKGGDYASGEIAGRKLVEARGGTVEILPYYKGKSTTGIIQSIRNSENACPAGQERKEHCGEP